MSSLEREDALAIAHVIAVPSGFECDRAGCSSLEQQRITRHNSHGYGVYYEKTRFHKQFEKRALPAAEHIF